MVDAVVSLAIKHCHEIAIYKKASFELVEFVDIGKGLRYNDDGSCRGRIGVHGLWLNTILSTIICRPLLSWYEAARG